MPTAVERLTAILRRALSLDAIDGANTQASFALIESRIDAGLSALDSAATPAAFATAKAKYGPIAQTLGATIDNLGDDLEYDAQVFYVVDQLLGGGPLRGATGIQRDFAIADRQLYIAGDDLERLGNDIYRIGRANSAAAVRSLEAQVVKDAKTLATDFGLLGASVSKVIDDLGALRTAAPLAAAATISPYAALAASLAPLADDFVEIGFDFTTLGQAFGGGGGVVATAAVISEGPPIGSALGALNQDFLSADAHLQGLAAPIANLLLPGPTVPTVG